MKRFIFCVMVGMGLACASYAQTQIDPALLHRKQLTRQNLLDIMTVIEHKDPSKTYIIAHTKMIKDASYIGRLFPAKLAAENGNGAGEVECQFDKDGHFYNCNVVSELPLDYGVGAAVINLASDAYVLDKPASQGKADHDWVLLKWVWIKHQLTRNNPSTIKAKFLKLRQNFIR